MMWFSEVAYLQEQDSIRSALQILITDDDEVVHEGSLMQTICPLQDMMTCSCKLSHMLMLEQFNVNCLNNCKTALCLLFCNTYI
jgi:hypothetical protein